MTDYDFYDFKSSTTNFPGNFFYDLLDTYSNMRGIRVSTKGLKSHLIHRGSVEPLQALIDRTGVSLNVSDYVKNLFLFSKNATLERPNHRIPTNFDGAFIPYNRNILALQKNDILFHEFAHALDFSTHTFQDNDTTISGEIDGYIFIQNYLTFIDNVGFYNDYDFMLVKEIKAKPDWAKNQFYRVEPFAQALSFYFSYKLLMSGVDTTEKDWKNTELERLEQVVYSKKSAVVNYVSYLESYLEKNIFGKKQSLRKMPTTHVDYKRNKQDYVDCFRGFNYDFKPSLAVNSLRVFAA